MRTRERRRPTPVAAQSGVRDNASVTRVVPSLLPTLNQLGLGRRHKPFLGQLNNNNHSLCTSSPPCSTFLSRRSTTCDVFKQHINGAV